MTLPVSNRAKCPDLLPWNKSSQKLELKAMEMNIGGAGGIRTPYLFDANEALSQMSYSPD